MIEAASTTALAKTFQDRPTIDRVVSADASIQVERLEGSPLVAEGRVNLIGLDSIQSRLGDRWDAKREQVNDYARRLLESKLEGRGWFVRVSETDYLVAQPTLDRYLGQAACVRMMREILNHFLGEATPEDVAVREVIHLSRTGLSAALVDRAMATARHDDAEDVASASVVLQGLAEPEVSEVASQPVNTWSPFVAADGRELKVSCNLEPVFELNTFQLIGYRLNRRVIQSSNGEVLPNEKVELLSRADIERVDLATLARGLSRLRSDTVNRPMMVMTPIFYPTLTGARGRANLIPTIRETREGMGSRVICEVESVEGLATMGLLSASAVVRPFCHAVIGRLSGEPDRRVAGLRDTGLNGVSFYFSFASFPTDEVAVGRLTRLVEYAKRAGRSAMVRGPFKKEDLVLAQAAGATHAILSDPSR